MMKHDTILKKAGIASFIMMASVFLSRIIGVFREMAIAGTGGIKAGVDAYQIAFIIPEILNHVVASGFLSITFIPIFTRYLSEGKKEEGYKIFSIILNCFGSLLIVLIFITMIFAHQFVNILAPGLKDPVTVALAVKMTRVIIPAQFFFFCGGLFMAVQFSGEKFFIAALAPLIYNLSIIAFGLLLSPFMGMEGFAWGVLAGAFLGNFAIQLMGTKKTGIKYSFIFDFKHPEFKKYIALTLPLMIGLTMTFSTEILMKFFGSWLSEGSISAMNYALRIMFILVGLFGQAVGVASYPFMARLAGEGDLSGLNHLLNTALKHVFLVIPFSVLFMSISREIVVLLFQRGRFDTLATGLTAAILPFFLIGTVGFSIQTLVSRGYYAVQNTLFPAVFSSICVVISFPAIYGLMRLMGPQGVSLGLSISVIFQAFVLFECWNKKSHNTGKKEVYLFSLRIIALSFFIAMIMFPSATGLRSVFDTMTFKGAFIAAGLSGLEFCMIFFIAGKLFRIKEIPNFYEKIFDKVFPWKRKLK